MKFNPDRYSSELHSELCIPLPETLKNACSERKSEFLAGRQGARFALNRFAIASDFILGISPDRSPLWPEGITGSISHASGRCFIVTGKKESLRSIGIDSENFVVRKSQIDKIESAITSPRERNWIDHLSADGKRTLLLGIIFTVKESIYKAIRPLTGAGFSFTDVEITQFNLDEANVGWQTTKNLGPGFPLAAQGESRFECDDPWIHAMTLIPRESLG